MDGTPPLGDVPAIALLFLVGLYVCKYIYIYYVLLKTKSSKKNRARKYLKKIARKDTQARARPRKEKPAPRKEMRLASPSPYHCFANKTLHFCWFFIDFD